MSLSRDSSPLSCFSCQTQPNDRIELMEIHLLEGDMPELLLRSGARGSYIKLVVDSEYEIKAIVSVFL